MTDRQPPKLLDQVRHRIRAKHYSIRTEITTGEKISFIVGQTNRAGVFITEAQSTRWEWYDGDSVPADLEPAIARFGNLAYYLKSSVPEKRRKPHWYQLATALFSALHSKSAEERENAFKPVEQEITAEAKAASSFRYICGSISTAIFIAVAMWIAVFAGLTTQHHCLCFGAVAGGVGAAISVLIRAHNLALEKTAPLWGAALQGATRTILGVAFGMVIVIAIKAEVVLAFFKDSFYGIMSSGIMAGFSERAVPEVLEGLAEKARAEAQHRNRVGRT